MGTLSYSYPGRVKTGKKGGSGKRGNWGRRYGGTDVSSSGYVTRGSNCSCPYHSPGSSPRGRLPSGTYTPVVPTFQ